MIPLLLAVAAAYPSLEGVTIGESMADVRATLGDPISVSQEAQGLAIWRYLEHGSGVFVDVLTRGGVAYSVTVVARYPGSRYEAPSGVAFGSTRAQVVDKLGAPFRTTTNDDDRSTDLWYRVVTMGGDHAAAGIWIYELAASDRLAFVQILPPEGLGQTIPPAQPVDLPDGSSIDKAIRPVQPDVLNGLVWTYAYLRLNGCGERGHWIPSRVFEPVQNGVTYRAIDATCSSGNATRTFYFDVRGIATAPSPAPGTNKSTIYIDPNALMELPHDTRSPAPSASPSAAP